MNALLIAGTGAKVGKTVLMTALISYWQQYCVPRQLGVFKPIECGGDDALYYSELCPDQSPIEISPLRYDANLPVPIAAARAGQFITLEQVWQQFEALMQTRDFVLIEAIGGLGSAVTHETTVADLAWDWRLTTILVVPVEPETIAQTVAHVALARQARVHLKGIVLNCVRPCSTQEQEDWAPIGLIQSLTQKPVLGCIPYMADLTELSKFAQVASNLDLESLMPGYLQNV